jgi:hypothetical protein
VDRLLQGLEAPQVVGTAVVVGVGLAIYAALTVRLEQSCAAARNDCDQVLNLVHRIPGIGGAQPASHPLGYLV